MLRNTFSMILSCAFLLGIAGTAAAADQPILGAPQPVPHEVTNYLPITADKNACIQCHRKAALETPKKAEIPLTHYEADGKLSALRWDCTICHAATTEKSQYQFKLEP